MKNGRSDATTPLAARLVDLGLQERRRTDRELAISTSPCSSSWRSRTRRRRRRERRAIPAITSTTNRSMPARRALMASCSSSRVPTRAPAPHLPRQCHLRRVAFPGTGRARRTTIRPPSVPTSAPPSGSPARTARPARRRRAECVETEVPAPVRQACEERERRVLVARAGSPKTKRAAVPKHDVDDSGAATSNT